MSKKATSSIYHFENNIQIQKLKCVLILGFNNDELTPPPPPLPPDTPAPSYFLIVETFSTNFPPSCLTVIPEKRLVSK